MYTEYIQHLLCKLDQNLSITCFSFCHQNVTSRQIEKLEEGEQHFGNFPIQEIRKMTHGPEREIFYIAQKIWRKSGEHF